MRLDWLKSPMRSLALWDAGNGHRPVGNSPGLLGLNCLALLAFAGSNTPYMLLRIMAAVLSAPIGGVMGLGDNYRSHALGSQAVIIHILFGCDVDTLNRTVSRLAHKRIFWAF